MKNAYKNEFSAGSENSSECQRKTLFILKDLVIAKISHITRILNTLVLRYLHNTVENVCVSFKSSF